VDLVRIYPNVQLGKDVVIDDFTIIGAPPRGKTAGALPTIIGDNSHIRSHSIIYAGTKIGYKLETGHGIMIREDNKIGEDCSIGTNSVLENGNNIGNNVRIHSNVFIPQYTVIEDHAWVGPNVVLTNDPHPPCAKCMKGPTIKQYAKIGANATILPMLTIGENSLIGAGSLVIRDVPPNSVVAGHPAKVIKKISEIDCWFDIIERPYQEML
jgi:acetyltransferase-like isoleucine patch superfamily enzyme